MSSVSASASFSPLKSSALLTLSRRARETKTGKHVLYISIWEARAHVEEVLRALGRDTAFIFQIEGQDLTYEEWERFIERVTELLL